MRVFNDGKTGKGQWIDLANIPWLVSYVCREREHAGCDVADTAVAEEDSIPGVSINWNWTSKEWIATLSDTVRNNHKSLPETIKSNPLELTPEKWARSAHRHGITVDFDASSPSQRREATRAYLLEYVETKLKKGK